MWHLLFYVPALSPVLRAKNRAAHCFLEFGKEVTAAAIEIPGTKELIRVKKWKLEKGYEYYGKKKLWTNADASLYVMHDMALGVLHKELPSSVEITKLYDGVSSFDQDAVVVAGYGLTEKSPVIDGERDGDEITTLRKGLGISAHVDLRYTVLLNYNFSLSASSSTHICWGDSGGPAFAVTKDGERQQIGILTGMDGGDCLGGSTYVSTYAYKDTIRNFLVNLKKENLK